VGGKPGFFFQPEDGGRKFIRNIGKFLPENIAADGKLQSSSWEL
jgi:hypothetical protein